MVEAAILWLAMTVVSFMAGRCTAFMVKDPGAVSSDTVIVRDTIRLSGDTLEAQVIEKEIVRYEEIPVVMWLPSDTVMRDSVVYIRDSVAVVPIMLKTYTDSTTYRAVVSGYEPRLEEIEVYQTNTVITNTVEASRWSIGLQGGVYMTPAGVQPGLGVGVSYRLPLKWKKKKR